MLALAIGWATMDLRGDGSGLRYAITSEPSLVGYYPFDADLGPEATDVHAWGQPAQSHQGVLVGDARTSADGAVGCQALSPGTGRVALGNVAAYEFPDGTGTVEVLLYQSEATPGYNPCFFACRDAGETRYSLHGDSQGKRLHFWNGSVALAFELATGASMIGRWSHVVFVFDAGQVTVFHDGASLGTQSADFGPSLGLPMHIGASDPNNSEPWPGLIDELAIYDAPLRANADHEQVWQYYPYPEAYENYARQYACSLGQANRAQGHGNVLNGRYWIWEAPADGWVLATTSGTACVGMTVLVEEVNPMDASLPPLRGWTNKGSVHYRNGEVDAGRSVVLFPARQGARFRFSADAGPHQAPATYPGTDCDLTEEVANSQAHQFALRVEQLPAPANDARAAAEVVRGEFPSVQGSNWGATREPGDPEGVEGLSGATVWWWWRSPTSREVTLSTRGSEIHTLLTVYELDPWGTMTPVASNLRAPELDRAADIGPFVIAQTALPHSDPFPITDILPLTSRVRFPAVQDSEYLIAVDGVRYADGAEGMGQIRLNWEGLTVEAFEEEHATAHPDGALEVRGKVLLANRGVVDSDRIRLRMIGTRIYPGTARANRDPGFQESLAAGKDLMEGAFLEVGALAPQESTMVPLDFTIPAPRHGLMAEISRDGFCEFFPIALGRFEVSELLDLAPLALPLKQTPPARPVDAWLAEQLSAETKAALEAYEGPDSNPAALQSALLRDLNALLVGPSLYDPARFEGVNLPNWGSVAFLLSLSSRDDAAELWLNRMLIQYAYYDAWDPPPSMLDGCVQWVTFTGVGGSHAWRAGAMIEVETEPGEWMPLAYYPLRHGPWPSPNQVRLRDGSGPYGAPGDPGKADIPQYGGILRLTAPDRLEALTQTDEVHGIYEFYVNGKLASSRTVDDKLQLAVVRGPGLILGHRTVAADLVSYEADLVVRAVYRPGDGKEHTSERVIHVVPAPKGEQTITFTEISPARYGDTDVRLSATATSGLPVRFRVLSGPASVVQDTYLRLTGAGLVTVRAEQEGNERWNPAPALDRALSVARALQAIVFPELEEQVWGGPPIVLAAEATSGLPVRFELVTGEATLRDNVLTPTAVGLITVRAVQAGDENWEPAASIERVIRVVPPPKGEQTITFEEIHPARYGDTDVRLSATATSGLPVRFRVLSGPASVVQDTYLRLTGAGQVTVRAEQDGNEQWNPAVPVDQVLSVAKAQQAIVFSELEDRLLGGPPIALAAEATSGLPVGFELVSGEATLSDSVLTPTAAGLITVRAVQTGNEDWEPAASIERSLQILAPDQTRPVIRAYRVVGAADALQFQVEVEALVGWEVRLEARADLNNESPWRPVVDWQSAGANPHVVNVPILSAVEFFRVVARVREGLSP